MTDPSIPPPPNPQPGFAPPPPPQAGFGAPGPAGPYGQAPRNNGLAIASMVLGIVWLWWIGSILAVIFGHVAKNQIDSSQGTQTGRGMAIAGLVLGYIGVGFLVLFIIAGAAGSN